MAKNSNKESNIPNREERSTWLKNELEKRNLTQYDVYKYTLDDPDLITIRRGDLSNWLSTHYLMNSHAYNFFVLFFKDYDRKRKGKKVNTKKPDGA